VKTRWSHLLWRVSGTEHLFLKIDYAHFYYLILIYRAVGYVVLLPLFCMLQYLSFF
jgi:hypothetical protein